MPVTDSFREYLVDQLAGLGELTIKRMFGGLGLYQAGVFFGLVDDDTLYFRVDDQTRGDFTSREMAPFRPLRREPNKVSDNYYQCPAEVLDDDEALVAWARRALRAAASPTAARSKRTREPASSAGAQKKAASSGSGSARRTAKRKPDR